MRLGAVCPLAVSMLFAVGYAVPAQAANDGGGAQAPSGSGANSQQQGSSTSAQSQPSSPPASTGGSPYGTAGTLPQVTVPGTVAKVMRNGLAAAPAAAPPAVQQAIWAANAIIGRPYIYGGGHQAFAASGYDCSGTVSFALHGGNLLSTPLDSTEFETWGLAGHGQWMTIYANGGHAYVNIAGIRLDTSAAGDPHGGKGPRWRPMRRSNSGYVPRHPLGY